MSLSSSCGLIDGTVGHVIDHHGQIGALLDQMHDVRYARDGRVVLHGNFQRFSPLPQGGMSGPLIQSPLAFAAGLIRTP